MARILLIRAWCPSQVWNRVSIDPPFVFTFLASLPVCQRLLDRRRSRANSAQLRQSRPDFGLVLSHLSRKSPSNWLAIFFRLKSLKVYPSSLGSLSQTIRSAVPAVHKGPYVGVSRPRCWSHLPVLGAISWAFIAKY